MATPFCGSPHSADDQDTTDLQKAVAFVVTHAAEQAMALERLTVVALGEAAAAAVVGTQYCSLWGPLARKHHTPLTQGIYGQLEC